MNEEDLVQTGMDAMDRFMDGFNSRVKERWVDSLNFPHTRIAPGVDSRVIQNREDYLQGFDYQPLLDSGWEFSVWDYQQILQVSTRKIHAAGQWSRLSNTGKIILTTPITYIITLDQGKWGVQSRFAVDSIRDDDMEETERPAFKIIEAFAQCYNSDNMRGCSTLLHYPYMDIGVGRITRLEHSSEFKLQRQGHLQIDALIAVQSGNRSVNLAIEASLTADSGRCDQYQGIVQVTHSNDHPGISGWSMIRLEPVPDKTD